MKPARRIGWHALLAALLLPLAGCFNGDAAGDFVIHPGQSWCIVSSPIEGETRLTVYAPEIYDWEKRTATASLYWADCQWQLPGPTTARSGSPHTLTTHLFRHSDRSP